MSRAREVEILTGVLLEDADEDGVVSALIDSAVIIHKAEKMTPGMRRYWSKLADSNYIKVKNVTVIDPWRETLDVLRQHYPPGTIVYRASTGGKYGKSASIVRL